MRCHSKWNNRHTSPGGLEKSFRQPLGHFHLLRGVSINDRSCYSRLTIALDGLP